jgi:imidazoleglycerol phosphate dehydratase HisB
MNQTEKRTTTITRSTSETKIELTLSLDGTGAANIQTGLGFFDHMLTALVRHSRMDLTLKCDGDLQVDDHHTVEDCALAIGQAIDQVLGDRKGIQRFGYSYAPLDEALVRCVIDLSGRPGAWVDLKLRSDRIGAVATENLVHFFQSLSNSMRATLHVDCIRGENDHHRSEAAFKSLALALKQAISLDGTDQIPSTKGTL